MNRQTQLINFCKPERIFCQVTKNPGRLGMMPVTTVLMRHAHCCYCAMHTAVTAVLMRHAKRKFNIKLNHSKTRKYICN